MSIGNGVLTLDRPQKLSVDTALEGLKEFNPRTELGRYIKHCFRWLPTEVAGELIDRLSRIVVLESGLSLVVIRANGRREDLGVVSQRVITTAGVGFLVDAWQNIVELESQKFHGLGTGVAAEVVGDTALGTELTTQYNPNNTRATGTTIEGASANIFRTVATNTVDATAAVTEHGIFDTATAAAGVLWDRSVFSVINLASGDGIQSTYDMTATSGG